MKFKNLNIDKFTMGKPSESDLELIKNIAPSSDINKDNIFTYRVVLCDNDIDRDYERFSHRALVDIANKFNGVVGIKNHDADVNNNHSRIYKTELVVDKNRKNSLGETYEYVIGYAYTLNNDNNKKLIDEIKTGIKKEVSIGFSSSCIICSLDGQLINECGHCIGDTYNIDGVEKQCIGIIDKVDDAYEFSFVSIPAQRKAGIVKQYNKINKEDNKMMTLKELSVEIAPKLDSDLAVKFMSAIDEVSKPESEIVKSLNSKIKELEDTIEAKNEQIEDMEKKENDRLIAEALNSLFSELHPINDTMRELACKELGDMIKVVDGAVVGLDEAKKKLSAEEYSPMFNSNTTDEKSNDINTDDLNKSKKELKNHLDNLNKKSLDFTRVSNFNAQTKKYSNRSAGIETVIK